MRTLFRLFLFLISSLTWVTLIEAEEIQGYIKRDIYLQDKEYTLYKGEKITCSRNKKNECCFEEYIGTICIPLNEISIKEVKMIDIYFNKILFTDDELAELDVCKDGQRLQKENDSFVWSYGFFVKSSEPISEDIFVELTHIPLKNDIPIYSLAFSKIWKGKADNKCHIITITKDDIDLFLSKYRNIESYLNIELDLNITVNVIFQVFSKRPESNYKNNIAAMKSLLPADNSLNWPPRTLPKFQ